MAERQSTNKTAEWLLKSTFVLLVVCASMGEWKQINSVYGGLPKVICIGVIAIALAYMLIHPNKDRVKNVLSPTLIYLSLILLLMLWSLAIWLMNFTDITSIVRGGSKMLYQTICILTAGSGVYLFGLEAVNLFAISLCMTNGLIMIFEIPNYGLQESINSLMNCVVGFGDAVGYARALEIHDLTFVFGQLIIYYAVFAPRKRSRDRKIRNRLLIACAFFFVVGMKRIAIPAMLLFLIVGLILKGRKKLRAVYLIFGIGMIAFFMLFIYGVRSGVVSAICARFGIDMMGRDYLWYLAGDYYTFSPLYMGKGFEFVDTIVKQWYQDGIINLALAFHNDILKVFLELGFFGFIIWSGMQYIVFPIFFWKYSDAKATTLYICELGYMTVTYMTDNTAFYFWCTIGLKLIVLAYAYYRKSLIVEEQVRWRPPKKEEIQAYMASLMLEAETNDYEEETK